MAAAIANKKEIVISEVLCYCLGKLDKAPIDKLKSVIVCFYREDELAKAKEILFTESGKIMPSGLPRNKNRKGDNKLKSICNDIFEILQFVDEKKLLRQFVAIDIERIPTVKI